MKKTIILSFSVCLLLVGCGGTNENQSSSTPTSSSNPIVNSCNITLETTYGSFANGEKKMIIPFEIGKTINLKDLPSPTADNYLFGGYKGFMQNNTSGSYEQVTDGSVVQGDISLSASMLSSMIYENILSLNAAGNKYIYDFTKLDSSQLTLIDSFKNKPVESIKEWEQRALTQYHVENLTNAKYHSLVGINYVDKIKNEKDFALNYAHNWLRGNYTGYILIEEDEKKYAKVENLAYMRTSLISLYGGYYLNQEYSLKYIQLNGASEDYYLYKLNVKNNLYPDEQAYVEMTSCYDAAEKIKTKMHSSGKIKEGMSQLEIAKAYYAELSCDDYPPSQLGAHLPKDQRNQYQKYDTAYSILVNKRGDCGARAAAWDVLMGAEGIQSLGQRAAGHVVSRTILDGVEYFVDWGNRYFETYSGMQESYNTCVANQGYCEPLSIEGGNDQYNPSNYLALNRSILPAEIK